MYNEIDKILDRFKEDRNGMIAKIWATQQGLNLDFYSTQLSSCSIYAPQEIKDLLMANDKQLYRKCIEVRNHGTNLISSEMGDILLGGRKKRTDISIDSDGNTSTTIVTTELNNIALKKMITAEKIADNTFSTDQDIKTIEKYYNIVEKKYIIPEKELLTAIRRLQPLQFKFFKIVDDYLNADPEVKIECKKETLYLNLTGGYQSSKTHASNVIFAYMLNILAQSKRQSGDYIIMAASLGSLRRNIINRICGMFPTLQPPAVNSTVWKLAHGVKISLLTTQLISYSSLKGSSLGYLYADEIDNSHPELWDLLQTRVTEKFEVNGKNKCVFHTTSNPKNPDHFISKFLYPEDKESMITKVVPTWENKYVSDEYIKRMTDRCGGVGTNKYRRELGGETLYLSTPTSVFPIKDEETFVDDIMDDYIISQCPTCEVEHSGDNKDCATCRRSISLRKTKRFTKCNIGYDFGTSVQKVFSAVFFYEDGEHSETKAILLDELVYEGGFDGQYAKAHGFDALERLKREDLRYLIERCKSICSNVELFIPHDAPHQILWMQNVINKYGLNCIISRPPTPNQLSVNNGIGLMRDMFELKRLFISKSCTNVRSQLFNYEYDLKKQEQGEEAVRKSHDHSIDALRYALTPELYQIVKEEKATDFI